MTHLAGEPAFGGAEPGGQPLPSVEVAAVVIEVPGAGLHGAHERRYSHELLRSLREARGHSGEAEHPPSTGHTP